MTSRTPVVLLAAATGFAVLFANDNLISTQQSNLTAQANATIGRPLTPGSVAGVARRTDRRAYRRRAAAAAAVGGAAYYGASSYYGSGASYSADPYYGSAAYLGDGVERRAIRRAYYTGGGYAYPSAAYDTGDAYLLNGAYISGDDAVRYCARMFRSYDSASQTFLSQSGERVSCPQ